MVNRKKWSLLLAISMIVIFIIITIIHKFYTSYNTLTITTQQISSPKLTNSCKLLVISDLHDYQFGEENSQLITKIKEQQPDAILMDGDMINEDSKDASIAVSLIQALKDTAPIYYALGNHELSFMEIEEKQDLVQEIEAAGAKVFEKEYQDIEIKDNSIRIGGLYDYAFAQDDEATTNPETMDSEVYHYLTDFQHSDNYKIMLSHRPDSFIFGEASKTWDIDLVISGHLHGGQIVLPFLGGLYAPDQGLFPEYVHGLYKKDKLNILITSGLGSHKEALPRWNNIPEIMVLQLNPTQ